MVKNQTSAINTLSLEPVSQILYRENICFYISVIIRPLHISERYKPQAKIIEILHIWIDIRRLSAYIDRYM